MTLVRYLAECKRIQVLVRRSGGGGREVPLRAAPPAVARQAAAPADPRARGPEGWVGNAARGRPRPRHRARRMGPDHVRPGGGGVGDGRGECARASRRVRRGLRADGERGPDRGPAAGRHRLRPDGGVIRRDHDRPGPGEAEQLHGLPDAAHRGDAGGRGPRGAERRQAGRDRRALGRAGRDGGVQRDLRGDGEESKKAADWKNRLNTGARCAVRGCRRWLADVPYDRAAREQPRTAYRAPRTTHRVRRTYSGGPSVHYRDLPRHALGLMEEAEEGIGPHGCEGEQYAPTSLLRRVGRPGGRVVRIEVQRVERIAVVPRPGDGPTRLHYRVLRVEREVLQRHGRRGRRRGSDLRETSRARQAADGRADPLNRA